MVEECFSWHFFELPKYVILLVPFWFGATYSGRQVTQNLGVQGLALALATHSIAAAEASASSAGEKDKAAEEKISHQTQPSCNSMQHELPEGGIECNGLG